MEGAEDWLMRPVLNGLCKYESLIDGTLHLHDLAIMNEAIDVQEYNRMIVEKAATNGRP